MNASPILAGVGPQVSTKTYPNGVNAAPQYNIAYDNYGIVVASGATKYSWIFNAPDRATDISVVLNPETGWTGSATAQLYGGWSHNIDITPTTNPTEWVAIGTTASLTTTGLVTLIETTPNIYPAYCIGVVSTNGVGIVDWYIAGS